MSHSFKKDDLVVCDDYFGEAVVGRVINIESTDYSDDETILVKLRKKDIYERFAPHTLRLYTVLDQLAREA